MIVHHSKPLTLIGGGKLGVTDISRALEIGESVVAADGGANAAVAQGITPAAVIGDFDSLTDKTRRKLPTEILHPIEDQNRTDFDKCMGNVSTPLILGVGFTGARIDHHLAAFNTLVRHAHQRCILLGDKDIAFLAPPSFILELDPGTPVSLFPMGIVEGVSDGLEWPIAGLTFTPDGRIGTSNAATGAISLAFTAPKMLVILPERWFEATAQALLTTTPRWQADA